MVADRLLATLGSAIGNCTLFGAVIAGWPGLPPWTPEAYGRAGPPIVLQLPFRPYIVAPASDHWEGKSQARCPRPEVGGWQFDLSNAPLPSGFDPVAWSHERLYACVRVGDEGQVLGVSLIGAFEPASANAMIEQVRRDWRFSPQYGQDGSGWAKVRINAVPPEPPGMPASSTE